MTLPPWHRREKGDVKMQVRFVRRDVEEKTTTTEPTINFFFRMN